MDRSGPPIAAARPIQSNDFRREDPSMPYLLRQIAADTAGQDLAEYGIALSVIALGVALVAAAIAGDVNTLWTNAQAALAAAV